MDVGEYLGAEKPYDETGECRVEQRSASAAGLWPAKPRVPWLMLIHGRLLFAVGRL